MGGGVVRAFGLADDLGVAGWLVLLHATVRTIEVTAAAASARARPGLRAITLRS
jgi:hypothetical protein